MMTTIREDNRTNRRLRAVWMLYALAAGLLFWVMETLIEAYIFNFEGSLTAQFFHPSLHALWMRAMAFGIIVIFVVYIQSARNRAQIKQELKDRINLAELTSEVGRAFTEEFPLDSALQRCAQTFVDHLDVLFARIWIYNEPEQMLELRASAGYYTHIDGPHSRIPYGKYKIGMIAKSRKPHLTNKIEKDDAISDQKWARREGIRSFAGHPLMIGDKLVGVIAKFSRKPISGVTLQSLGSVADEIALGIHQKQLNEQVLKAKKEWEKTFDTIPDLVFVTDPAYSITHANRAFAYTLGMKPENISGKKCYELFHGTSAPPEWCPHSHSRELGEVLTWEVSDGHLAGCYQVSVSPIKEENGNIAATVHIARNITNRKMMEQKLRDAAMTDALTGLLNRRGFYMFAEQQCRLADRSGRVLPLLYIDLDGMKAINDELGHIVGDQALIDSAAMIRKSFRESDIIARLGGDEFAVMLSDSSDPEADNKVLDHLHENIRRHNKESNRKYELIFSVGVAHYDPAKPFTLEELIHAADKDMYRDKKRHKAVDG